MALGLASWPFLGLEGSARGGPHVDLYPVRVGWGDFLPVQLASGGPRRSLGPGRPSCDILGAGNTSRMNSPSREPLEAVHFSATSLASSSSLTYVPDTLCPSSISLDSSQQSWIITKEDTKTQIGEVTFRVSLQVRVRARV